MASITNKIVTVPLLGTFKEESDKAYVGNEALTSKLASYVQTSSLTEYLKKEEIDTELESYTKDEELTTTLGGYLKKDEIDTTLTDYAKTSEIEATYATKTEMTNLGTIIGTCLFADLEDKKAETGTGDCWVVTDKNNHIFYYNGTDYIDCGGEIDLSGYLQSTVAESTYATKTELESYVKAETLQEATAEDIKALFASEAA